MKGFHRRRGTVVTLTQDDQTLDVRLTRLAPGMRAFIIGDFNRRHGDGWMDEGKERFALMQSLTFALLGLSLGDQIETKKADDEEWEDYGDRVLSELVAANLDEGHVAQLTEVTTEWLTLGQDSDEIEHAAGN